VTTSWSIPSSPPGGPQVNSLRAVLLLYAILPLRPAEVSESSERDIISLVKPSDFDKEYEGFVARYSEMSDGELLKLATEPWALSESAWDALEDELEHRKLEVPEPEPAPQNSRPEMRDLVVLRRFRDIPEALLAKGRLDASGVECFLADENMVRMDWLISNLLGGVKLLVEPNDFTRASRILNEAADHLDAEADEF
jgi:Putative prokaryotic signal transducing protein